MELEYLKEFLTVAKCSDLAEAADEMYLSSSAISRHVRKLEEDMGVEVFERTSRAMQLNEYGEILQKYAQKLLQIEKDCRQEILMEMERQGNVLRVASLFGIAYYKICHVFNLFQQRYPECQLFIYEADTKENIQKLSEKECDFAFVLSKTLDSGKDCEVHVVSQDRLAAVVPKKHTLANYAELTPELLEREPLIFPAEHTGMYDFCMEYFREATICPDVKVTTFRTENMIDLAEKGMGISLIMEKEAKEYSTADVVIVPLKPEVSVNVLLICEKGAKKYKKKFQECLQEVLEI